MEIKSVSKYNRISPRKTRLIANMVRGQKVGDAFECLRFTPKKAAKLVAKTLKSAVANAEHNFKLDKNDLIISKITVDEGPTLKRMRPRAKGAAYSIRKRTAHVTVVVEEVAKAKKIKKEDAKTTKTVDADKKIAKKVDSKKKMEQKDGS